MDAQDFWKRVNSLIKSNGLKQETVCHLCEINYQTFRGWIVRNSFPDVFQSLKIAKALNTTVEFLVTGKEENLTQEETELLSNYRKLDADTKKIINLQVAAVANVLKSK